MPLLGGDSNSFWRFDVTMIVKGFVILLGIRAVTIMLEIYPTYIPVFDDVINGLLAGLRWLSINFNNFAARYMSM